MADAEGDIQNLEFKSPEDEAWYQVSIQYGCREGSVYFDVHYKSGHRRGQVYSVNLNDSNQVEETIARFRCESTQLKDSQHWELQGEPTICAAYRSKHNNDIHYFDAMIKKVNVTNTVDAKVLWNDGPSKGEITTVPANDMRLLSPGGIEAHPVIQFLETALQRNAASSDPKVPLNLEDD